MPRISRKTGFPRVTANGVFNTVGMAYRFLEAGFTIAGRLQADHDYRENIERISGNQFSGRLKDAAPASVEDLMEAGFINPDDQKGGFRIGEHEGYECKLPGDAPVSVMAPSGTLKTWAFTVPLIISTAMGERPESCFVLDLKGTLYLSTAAGRSSLTGNDKAALFNPWMMYGIPGGKINPLNDLVRRANEGKPVKDASLSKLAMIFPDPASKGQNAYGVEAGIRVSSIVMVHVAELEPQNCKLSYFSDLAAMPQVEFAEFMALLTKSPAGEGYVSRYARKLHSEFGDVESESSRKLYNWMMDEVANAFELYSEGTVLRYATDETTLDIAGLKQQVGEIYFMFPAAYVDSHGKFASLVMDYVITTIASAEGDVRTNLILEELANWPHIKSLPRCLRLFRESLTRVVSITQDRDGFAAYKKDGGYRLFEANCATLTWGVRDTKHAADIEARAGHRPALVPTWNTQVGERANTGGMSASERLVPLLNQYEVTMISKGYAIFEMPGHKTFVLKMPPYDEIPHIAPYVRDLRIHPPPPVDHE
ncbi:MAG: type IV secretory system conjugative DNA transfer family protein [Pseudomonadota bacterium]